MKKNNIFTKLFFCLILFSIIINFIPVNGLKNNIQIQNLIINDSFDIIPGLSTKKGTWILTVYHKGEWNGHAYEGVWFFEISTDSSMTAEQKAQAMRDAINNKQGCPLSAAGTGCVVSVSSENGQIIKYSSKSDDGQSIHGTKSQITAFSFTGTPSSGIVKVFIGNFVASTTTEGKSLIQIHNELYNQLRLYNLNVILDSSERAFYVIGTFNSTGIDSDDPWLASMGEFILNITAAPFGIYVGMQEDIMGSSGSTIKAEFNFINFRCIEDTYKINVSDELGWKINPNYYEQGFTAGEKKIRTFDIIIPTGIINTTNIVNVTITSLNSPWIKCSGYLKIIVNNPPSITIIDGIKNGIPQTEYQYNFTAIEPDGDQIYFFINWGDGNITDWTGPFNSGEKFIKNHTWNKKGIYIIKAAAKDTNGLQGSYGTLTVTIPRNVSKNSLINLFLDRFFYVLKIFKRFLL